MSFNKVKCKILHLHQNNPRYAYIAGEEQLCREGLGIQVDKKLDMSQECLLADQKVYGGGCPPLLCPHEAPSRVLQPCLRPPRHENMELLEWEQKRVTKMTGGLEHLSYKDRLRKLV